MVAFALDYLVILGYLAILLGLGLGARKLFGPWEKSIVAAAPAAMDVFAFVVAILPVILYFAISESSPSRATWGKRISGLAVVGPNDSRLSQPRALVRAAVKFLPWQLAHSCLFRIEGWPLEPMGPSPTVMAGLAVSQALALWYALAIALAKSHRAPYDWLAGSLVVTTRQSA